ncbi:uncharacterized protein TrAFT101_005363 [Trichoderma asperellum]|uniref:uncharacterized protein n=1 Tax=Trichoderma asperellum TaxID=101201 RepID=UPI00332C1F95|nr:hypothetical protein TrAFT101_005363 [Trichoderma asperellum]
MPSDDVQLGSPDGVVGCRVHGLSLDLALKRAWSSELDPEQTRRSLDSRVLGPGPGRDMVKCFRSRQNTCSRIDHPSPSSSQVQITAIVCAAGGGPYPPASSPKLAQTSPSNLALSPFFTSLHLASRVLPGPRPPPIMGI